MCGVIVARFVTSPCRTTLYPSPLNPASERILRISVAVDGSPLILYDVTGAPFLFRRTVLVNETSSESVRSLLLPPISGVLLKTSVADMCFAGLPVFPPLKMSSDTLEALSERVDLGPRTNPMASPQFDLPLPLGPVMAVNPSSKGMVVSPPNDLKFSTSILTRCIPSPLSPGNKSPTTTPVVPFGVKNIEAVVRFGTRVSGVSGKSRERRIASHVPSELATALE